MQQISIHGTWALAHIPPDVMEQEEEPEVTLKNGITAISAGNQAKGIAGSSTQGMARSEAAVAV